MNILLFGAVRIHRQSHHVRSDRAPTGSRRVNRALSAQAGANVPRGVRATLGPLEPL